MGRKEQREIKDPWSRRCVEVGKRKESRRRSYRTCQGAQKLEEESVSNRREWPVVADPKCLPSQGKEFESFLWVFVISESSPGPVIIKSPLPLSSFLPWGAYFYF